MSDSVANACKARAVGGCTAEKAALAPLRSADRVLEAELVRLPARRRFPRRRTAPTTIAAAPTTTLRDGAARERSPSSLCWAPRHNANYVTETHARRLTQNKNLVFLHGARLPFARRVERPRSPRERGLRGSHRRPAHGRLRIRARALAGDACEQNMASELEALKARVAELELEKRR